MSNNSLTSPNQLRPDDEVLDVQRRLAARLDSASERLGLSDFVEILGIMLQHDMINESYAKEVQAEVPQSPVAQPSVLADERSGVSMARQEVDEALKNA